MLTSHGNKGRFVKVANKVHPKVTKSGIITATDRETVIAYSPVAWIFKPTLSGRTDALQKAKLIAITNTGIEIIAPLHIQTYFQIVFSVVLL